MTRDDELRRLMANRQALHDEMSRRFHLPRALPAIPAIPLLTDEGTVWQITTLEETTHG